MAVGVIAGSPAPSPPLITDFLGKDDRSLIRDAAQIGSPRGYQASPRELWLASELLHIAAHDHRAVADAFVGRDLDTLMAIDWRGHEQGVRELIDHIDDNAESPDHLSSSISGQTARNLATWVGGHPWTMSEGVTQSVAGVLGNFIPSAVGVPDGTFSVRGFSQMTPEAIRNVFAAMNRYHDPGVTFTAAAYSAWDELNYLFGLHGGVTRCSDLAQFVGRIDHFAKLGMNYYLYHARITDAKNGLGFTDNSRRASYDSVSWMIDSATETRRFYHIMLGLHDAHRIPQTSALMRYFRSDRTAISFRDIENKEEFGVQFIIAVKSIAGVDLASYDGEMAAGETGAMDDH